MLARFIAISLLAVLSACATEYDRLRSYSGADAGFVVASVGMTANNTMHYSHVSFRLKGTGDLALFEYSPKSIIGGTPTDFRMVTGGAVHVVRNLPPGEYEIYDFGAGADYGTSMVWYTVREKFSIPFVVRSGETTYLGQYLVGLARAPDSNRPIGANLEISNEEARDLTWKPLPAAQTRQLTNVAASLPTSLPEYIHVVRSGDTSDR